MDSSPTVLVTGGAGYVGSHTVVELLKNSCTVVVIDNLVNSCKGSGTLPVCLQRVQDITGKPVIFYNVDLLDSKALESVFEKHKIDLVLHFAALKAVGESCQIPLSYYRNNVVGSIVLLETMKQYNVYKLVYSSSATVYGTPQYLPFTEAHPTGQGCTNPYGKTKYFVEEIIQDLVASDKKWSAVALRYFNPVGAHESGRIGEAPQGVPNNLMPYIAQVAVGERKDLKVYGSDYDTPDGTGVRDYIHITDLAEGHVKAIWRLMKQSEPRWQAYNLGTGQGHSVLEVIHAFEEVCGRKIPYEICPRRPGDIASSYADPSLAKKELNWEAKKSLSDMCRDMWRWQSQNPHGFEEEKQ
ncbi:UDP-glucose 4-epimerase [Gryllus bimaculatus]|nr:UDP-glucose 4-epimerase [Gryllus bimaculatus]